jgi:adenine C2-methylase RlmN of 23S rRNA A2503 and tRNA A37
MVSKRELSPKPLLDEAMLVESFIKNGINIRHIKTIYRLIIQNNLTDFNSLSKYGIPKKAIELINSEYTLTTSKVISRSDAKDGSTTKLLIELQDGQRIESCIMRYGAVELSSFPIKTEGKFSCNRRATLCVSSQVGCAMGCTFCATGTMNLLANLASGEILEQLCIFLIN